MPHIVDRYSTFRCDFISFIYSENGPFDIDRAMFKEYNKSPKAKGPILSQNPMKLKHDYDCLFKLVRELVKRRTFTKMLKYLLFYRALLRLLLENLNDEAGTTRALVFGVLTEMLKQETLIASFQGFTELIILKVLESHRDPEKDVSDIN